MTMAGQTIELGVQQRRGREALALLRANRLALVGACISTAFVVVGIVGLVIIAVPSLNYLYLQQNLLETLKPPFTAGHILGTDNYGRDVAWRVVAGVGISLAIGVAVTGLSVALGITVGAVAGFFGGRVDAVLRAVIDLTWGFPLILVAVIVVGVLSPGLGAVVVAVALVNWAGFARIIRAETVSLRQREFIEAARALGVSRRRIIQRHILPNTVGSTLVMSSYYIAATVIVEAGLAFIGLGAQPPLPSLGQLIYSGTEYIYNDVWLPVVPGIVIALIVLGLNTLGDGLRDIFDPRMRRW